MTESMKSEEPVYEHKPNLLLNFLKYQCWSSELGPTSLGGLPIYADEEVFLHELVFDSALSIIRAAPRISGTTTLMAAIANYYALDGLKVCVLSSGPNITHHHVAVQRTLNVTGIHREITFSTVAFKLGDTSGAELQGSINYLTQYNFVSSAIRGDEYHVMIIDDPHVNNVSTGDLIMCLTPGVRDKLIINVT